MREALGRAYFRSGRFAAAAVEFGAVVERHQVNDYAHFCLGRALAKTGRTDPRPPPPRARLQPAARPPRLQLLPGDGSAPERPGSGAARRLFLRLGWRGVGAAACFAVALRAVSRGKQGDDRGPVAGGASQLEQTPR